MNRTLTDDDVHVIVSMLAGRVTSRTDTRLVPLDWDMQKRVLQILGCAIGAEQEAQAAKAAVLELTKRMEPLVNTEALTSAIAQKIAAELVETGRLTTNDILTTEQAMVYAKITNRSRFSAWCKRWWIRPHVRGRYSRNQLDFALQREARLRAH